MESAGVRKIRATELTQLFIKLFSDSRRSFCLKIMIEEIDPEQD
jgi:hypothetical protein